MGIGQVLTPLICWFISSLLLRHRDEIIAFGDAPDADVVEISE